MNITKVVILMLSCLTLIGVCRCKESFIDLLYMKVNKEGRYTRCGSRQCYRIATGCTILIENKPNRKDEVVATSSCIGEIVEKHVKVIKLENPRTIYIRLEGTANKSTYVPNIVNGRFHGVEGKLRYNSVKLRNEVEAYYSKPK